MKPSRWTFLVAIIAHAAICSLLSAGTLRVPQDHATIASAYAVALQGDEIVVAPGVYHERIALNRFGVTIRSEAGPDETIIDAEFLGGVFVINPFTATESFVVEGFTIRNGRRERGGAFDFVRKASLTLRNCVVEHNEATGGTNQGGAIYAPDIQGASSIVIEDCVFQDNFAGGTGSLAKGGALRASAASLEIRRSHFYRNVPNACVIGDGPILIEDSVFADQRAGVGVGRSDDLVVRRTQFLRHDSDSRGPGLSVQPGTKALIEDCLFEDNRASGYGGASRVEEDAHATFVRCEFRGNVSSNSGGAVVLLHGSSSEFIECLFEDNYSGATSPVGAGVAVFSAQTAFRRCVFRANGLASTNAGSAIGFDGQEKYFGGTKALVEDCDFIGNGSAPVRIQAHSEVTVVGSRFIGNPPNGIASSGAMWINQTTAPVVIANTLFAGNRTDANTPQANATGSAIQARSLGFDLDITIINCAFVGNRASPTGGAIYNRAGANPRVINCVFVDNTPTDIAKWGLSAAMPISHSVLEGGWEGEGNIDGVALFMDPIGPDGVAWSGDEDYSPAPGSPAVDVGDTAALAALGLEGAFDLAGRARVVDAIRYANSGVALVDGGPVVDAGPVEARAGLLSACVGDADGDGLVDFADLGAVLTDFGLGGPAWLGDVNGDGVVNFEDLNMVLTAFGRGCVAR